MSRRQSGPVLAPPSIVPIPVPDLEPSARARLLLLRERAAEGSLTLTCGGRSMEPALSPGERFPVRPLPPSRGVAAAFVTPAGTIIVHRLIWGGPGGWWVEAGDNRANQDFAWVHESQLIGIAAVPKLETRLKPNVRAAWSLLLAAAHLLRRRIGRRRIR